MRTRLYDFAVLSAIILISFSTIGVWAVRALLMQCTVEDNVSFSFGQLPKDDTERMLAVKGIGELKRKNALPLIREAVADNAYAVRCWAIWSLGELDDRESIEILQARLDFLHGHADWFVTATESEMSILTHTLSRLRSNSVKSVP